MILYGDVLDEIVDACRARQSPLLIKRIERRINADNNALAAMVSWAGLRRVEKDFDVSTLPVQLPADVARIDMIWDDDNGIEYLDRARPDAEHDEYAWRYYTYPVGEALAIVKDATLMLGRQILVSSDLSDIQEASSVIGEYFYVEGDDQLYKITGYNGGAFDISPAYRGSGDTSSVTVIVRPPTTLMLDLVPPAGAAIPTTKVQLHYGKKPDSLREPHDVIMFPTSDVLVLRTLSKMSEAQPDRPVSQARVQEALREAIAINPGRPMPRVGRGLNGRKVTFNATAMYSGGTVGGYDSRIHQTWMDNRS